MALPSERESLNKLVGFAAAANKRRKNQAKTPTAVNSDPSAIQVQSFEEAMNVAMSAIIGGPSHVAKDFSTLQSLAKSKDNVYNLVSDSVTYLKRMDDTLDTMSAFVEQIANTLEHGAAGGGDKVQLIQLAAGDSNVGDLLMSLQNFDDASLEKIEKIVTELNKLNSVDLSQFKENVKVLDDDVIKNLSGKFDDIKDLYENHVASAADAAAKGQQDLKTINETNEESSEIIIEGKKPNKKQLEEAKTSYEGMASTILAGAFVMIIGALIIKAMPEFPELALKFAVTLTLFTAAVMAPLVLADIIMSKYGGKGAQSFGLIGDIIATAALVMIIGALFMKIPDMAEKSLEFTKQLTIFLVVTIGALALVSRLAKPELLESVKSLSSLIVASAIVMVIGALFMQIDWLPKNALKFGLTLGLFIAAVLGPLMLLSFIGGNKKIQHDLKGVSSLIVTCTIIMMIGALFMLLDNGKFVKNALIFGLILSFFIALVLLPFLILKPLIGIAEHTLKDVTRLIVVCTLIMLIGAAFVMIGGGKFVLAALTFAVVLTFFITLCILPLLLLKPFIQQGLRMLRDVTLFVMVSTIIMLIGAYLILNHPEYIWAALKFGLILALFIAGTIFPVILLGRFTKRALTEMVQIAVFIAISAAVMLIGAYFMQKGYGWASIGFTIVFGLFVLAMAGIMYVLSTIPNLKQAVINAATLGVAVTLLSVAFGIMGLSMSLLSVGDFVKFMICTTIITGAFAILGIPEVAAFVELGALVASSMGIALMYLSAAFAILHFAMLVSDPFVDFTKLLGALVVSGLVFAALGALAPLIYFGSIAAGAMGLSLMVLSGAFVILHFAMTVSEPWEDFSKLALTLLAAGGVYTLLGALSALIVLGSVAALTMSISLMTLGAAFLVLHKCVGTDEMHPWEDFEKMALAILAAGGVFSALALLSPLIVLGSVAAMLMSPALILVSVAFGIVSSTMQANQTIVDDLYTMDAAIVVVGLVFTALGALSIFIALGSLAAAAMSAGLLLVTVSFNIVHLLLENIDPIADMVTMIEAIGLMGALFGALVLLTPLAIAGHIAMLFSGTLAIKLSNVVWLMAKATKEAADMPDPLAAFGKIESFFILAYAFPSLASAFWMKRTFYRSAGLAEDMSRVIGKIGKTVGDIADLKVATDWNEKGDPIGFRHLNDQDFKNAGENIATIITTIGGALTEVYTKNEKMFNDGDDSIIYTVLKATMYMGLVISFIARGLQSYANLLIPDEWNSEGKPIHFSPMEEQDFKNAANGINIILSTLGGAILDFIDKNPKLVEYMEETRGGFMGLSKNPSKFAVVVTSGMMLGDLISNIATGLTAYANMMYPTHWNNEGKPDRFETMTDAMILQAKVRIVDILTDMTNAISAAYDTINGKGFFAGIFGSPSKVKEKIECFTSIGGIISSIAEGLSKYAALMIPDQWNKEGKPIHFIKMSDADIMMAKLNIISILKTMALAVNDAYWSIPGSASEIKERIEAFVPIGDLIGNFATGLQAYAQLLIPTKWNKEGKPIAFEKMSDVDIMMAGFNIGLILRTMAWSVWRAYNNFKEGKDEKGNPIGMKPDDIKKVIEAFKPIGDMVANTATGLQGYASLLVPDKWNSDGKPIHYKALPNNFFDTVSDNIGKIMTGVTNALIETYNNHQELFDGKNPIINKVIDFGKGIGEVVNGIATGLQAYANLTIPTHWNNEGKPDKFRPMLDTDITTAKQNIALLLISMADALLAAYEDPSKIENIKLISSQASPVQYLISAEGQKKFNGIKDLTKDIVDLIADISDIITNIGQLKVPTGFDKDGKATGYKQINETTIANITKNIGMLLLAIPEAIVVNCIEGEHAAWFDGLLPAKEKLINNTLNSAGHIIATIMNNIDDLIEDDSVELITNVFKYKKKRTHSAEEFDALPDLFGDLGMIMWAFTTLALKLQLDLILLSAMGSAPFKTAEKSVNAEGRLIRTILHNASNLTDSADMLEKIHSVSISNVNDNGCVLNMFDALCDLVLGFAGIHKKIIEDDVFGVTATFDDKAYLKFGDLVTMLGLTIDKVAVQANAITKSVDSITDVTMNKKKLAEALTNMKAISALLSDTFENGLTKTESKTLFNFFGFKKTVTIEKDIDTAKILGNVEWLSSVIETFALSAKAAEKINGEEFDGFGYAIATIEEYVRYLNGETISKYSKVVEKTDKFVKAIGSIKVKNVIAFERLLEQIDRLSQHMGNLDNFTKVLAEQLASTLDQLTKQIRDAQRTIKEADRIQRQRHELINNSVAKVQKMMETTLHVDVTSTTTGSETTSEATEEQR